MSAQVTVRLLQNADLEPLRWVVYRAYLHVLLELYGQEAAAQYEIRSRDFMAMYVRRSPEGCFTAAAGDGTLIGAVFCFVWDEVGWFGSLAVAPEWQGRGVGQLLTERATTYLQAQGCRRIGLETWPESPAMRYLYGKFGFQPCRSTIKFSRPVTAIQAPAGAPAGGSAAGARADSLGAGTDWSVDWVAAPAGAQLPAALNSVSYVTARLRAASPDEPAVDYRLEVQVPVEAGWAEVVVLHDRAGAPAAFALCYVKRSSGAPASTLDARLLTVAPSARDTAALSALLAACDRRALLLGKQSVTCDVYLRHGRAATLLRRHGFRPVYELLRLERPLEGFDPMTRSPLLDCARWAG